MVYGLWFIFNRWQKVTLANVNCVGYIPVENDRLMIDKGWHILFLINFNTSVGMLFGPDDLLLSKESIINQIPWLSADSNRKKLWFGVFKKLENSFPKEWVLPCNFSPTLEK